MKSMTGYGMQEIEVKKGKITLEAKTVNHRFCEVNLRLPARLTSLEAPLAEFAKKFFSRGRVDLFVRDNAEAKKKEVKIDEARLQEYLKLFQLLSQKIPSYAPPQLENFLNLPQVLSFEDEPEDLASTLSLLREGFRMLLEKVDQMRILEGKGIQKDLLNYLESIAMHVRKIEERRPQTVLELQARLKERIEKLAQSSADEWRLAQEIAYFVDRSDFSEELQRLKSHLLHFRQVLEENEPIGRKLDFLLQEMNREVNTLGSKASDFEISKWIVDCKHELEKMKEQVQNVE